MSQSKMISVCIGLTGANHVKIFEYCHDSLCKALTACRLKGEIVLVYWPTPNDPDWINQKLDSRVNLIKPDVPFTRGGARNISAKAAKGEILFFCDADMLVPLNLLPRALELIKNKAAFFPYYKRLDKRGQPAIDGIGTGNCILHKSSYIESGGFPEYNKWGGEDTKFTHWFGHRNRAVREQCPGFFHQYHAVEKKANNK